MGFCSWISDNFEYIRSSFIFKIMILNEVQYNIISIIFVYSIIIYELLQFSVIFP